MYLSHINSLRALAILGIVAGHSAGFFSWQENPFTHNALKDLAANGSVIFVFISGYLFHHLSTRFQYAQYLLKKTKYVLVPYLLVSIPAIVYGVFWNDAGAVISDLAGTSRTYQIFWFYLHGETQINYPLWFIPVILSYYVAAPVFRMFIRYPTLYWLIPVLLPISLVAHRPNFPNPDLLHSLLYFLSAYVLGMFSSQFRDKVDLLLEKYLEVLFLIFISHFLTHLFLAGHHGNYHVKHIFSLEKGYIDWLFLQKIALTFLLLGLVKRYDSLLAKATRYIGEASFSIYFLHAYLLYALKVGVRWQTFEGNLIKWILLSASIATLSVGITRFVQKIFGKKSRLLIGS